MLECAYKSSVGPYHDGELDAEQSRDFERHVLGCDECSAGLREAECLSKLLATGRSQDIEPDELARIHDAIDELSNRSLFKFAAGLAAIAASILIVSAAWLYDGSAPRSPINYSVAPVEQPWERLASTGQIELPQGAPETGVAERRTTEWMAVSLGAPSLHEDH